MHRFAGKGLTTPCELPKVDARKLSWGTQKWATVWTNKMVTGDCLVYFCIKYLPWKLRLVLKLASFFLFGFNWALLDKCLSEDTMRKRFWNNDSTAKPSHQLLPKATCRGFDQGFDQKKCLFWQLKVLKSLKIWLNNIQVVWSCSILSGSTPQTGAKISSWSVSERVVLSFSLRCSKQRIWNGLKKKHQYLNKFGEKQKHQSVCPKCPKHSYI